VKVWILRYAQDDMLVQGDMLVQDDKEVPEGRTLFACNILGRVLCLPDIISKSITKRSFSLRFAKANLADRGLTIMNKTTIFPKQFFRFKSRGSLKLLWLPLLVTAIFIFVFLPGCSPVKTEQLPATSIKITTLKGPSSIGLVELMDKEPVSQGTNYEFTVAGSPDAAVAALTSGSADIAALPSNMASNIYQKTNGDIVVLAISSLGNFSLLESGSTVNTMSDLRGKTIHASGQGANPQYILEYLLTKVGLSAGSDVEIVWHAEQSELLALLASGEVNLAMLPEPFTASALAKNSGLRVALQLDEIWERETGEPLVTGCIVARKGFIESNQIVAENGKSLIDEFLYALEDSVTWTQANPDEAAVLCVKYDIVANEVIAKDALSRLKLTYLAGDEMKSALYAYLEILHIANPQSIGGSMPDENFYYRGKA